MAVVLIFSPVLTLFGEQGAIKSVASRLSGESTSDHKSCQPTATAQIGGHPHSFACLLHLHVYESIAQSKELVELTETLTF